MNKKQKKNLYRIIAALVLVLILKLLPQFPTPVELLLYCIPYLVVGWDVLRKALLGIKNRQPFDECFLMAVATVGAFALGDYVEGCAVIIFYQIGELFQSVAVGKSRQSISSLMDIRPDYANVEDEDGKLEQVDPDDVEVGTVIVVQPGERVPIDGIIVEGTSALNTAALTGEDEPAAQKVIAADDDVDYDFNAIKRTLAAEIAADPAKVDAALDLLMVIKYLERIGDHAVNLAEWVEFLRTGRYQNEAMF